MSNFPEIETHRYETRVLDNPAIVYITINDPRARGYKVSSIIYYHPNETSLPDAKLITEFITETNSNDDIVRRLAVLAENAYNPAATGI